jgi:hypothetical protein
MSNAACTVTYETYTEDSLRDGDMADHGWIQPVTERLRSLRKGGRRIYDRNVRMARAGKFDWRLRDAIEFIAGQSFASHEVAVTERGVRVSGRAAYHESEYRGELHGAELHIECSAGTAQRLARALADKFGTRIERG